MKSDRAEYHHFRQEARVAPAPISTAEYKDQFPMNPQAPINSQQASLKGSSAVPTMEDKTVNKVLSVPNTEAQQNDLLQTTEHVEILHHHQID